jgi:hypothetical protein
MVSVSPLGCTTIIGLGLAGTACAVTELSSVTATVANEKATCRAPERDWVESFGFIIHKDKVNY